MANVTVIPKCYLPKSIECDLRPISFIPTISKLLEAKLVIGFSTPYLIKFLLNNLEQSEDDQLLDASVDEWIIGSLHVGVLLFTTLA